MTMLDQFSSTARLAGRANVVARLVQAISSAYTAFRNRREFYRLGELSDAELADIGLTRADLHVAIGQPFGMDPTASLNTMVRRRFDDERAARSVC